MDERTPFRPQWRMITGAQVQAARALLRWTARDLARRAVVSVSTVNLIEGAEGLPSTTRAQLEAVQATLEAAGIEFIDTAGVQLRPKKRKWRAPKEGVRLTWVLIVDPPQRNAWFPNPRF